MNIIASREVYSTDLSLLAYHGKEAANAVHPSRIPSVIEPERQELVSCKRLSGDLLISIFG